MWRVNFVMKKNGRWINAFQEFEHKKLAEQSYEDFMGSEYFKAVEKPVKIAAKQNNSKED